jgi:large subunit ribosomal protein L25
MRNTGRTPAIVFGGSSEPKNIELDHNALWFALKKETFHSSILEMELDGTKEKVLLRDVQYHPFKQLVLHVDFQRVDEKTRVHKKVPLHFEGEEASSAVKIDKCLINKVMNEVEVECLATNLPESITVDLSTLTKGDTIHVRDLKLPAGTKAVMHGRTNLTVVTAVAPRGAAVVVDAADAASA